jgi:AraC family transcriptional regulator of adaptative response/methylated-DNA-[protein]-cysteine methyltransferase
LRGCQRCHSERYPDVLPVWLPEILDYMKQHRNERLTETALTNLAGANISTVRRYFLSHLGTTPLAFHRRIRLQYAYQLIQSGSSYLAAAYECGYESASGFREAFKRHYGITPGRLYASR